MTILTAGEIATLRDDHPHALKLYMSVLNPDILWTGTIGGTPSTGDRSLTVVDVSGTFNNINNGNTLILYSPSGKILARRRVKTHMPITHVITVDENSTPWVAGYTVKVLDTYEFWSVYPRIVLPAKPTPSNPGIFYKDYDRAYKTENSDFAPIIIMGPPKAGFLDGPSITFDLDGSESYVQNTGKTISTYTWSCDGGTIANAALATTTITFTTAGQYWLTLQIVDSNGVSQMSHRPIFVHERTGTNAPITSFEISNMNGAWDQGGWRASIKMLDDATLVDIPDFAMVVIWCESWYNGVEQYIGPQGNIRLVGYINSETIVRNMGERTVEFDLETINGLMNKFHQFNVTLQEVNKTPTKWYNFYKNTLTIPRAICHLWMWHSTLFSITDVFLDMTDTRSMAACDDFAEGALFNMVNWAYERGTFSKAVCDRMGRVHVEQDLQTLNDTTRAANKVSNTMMEIIDQDRRGDDELQVQRKTFKNIPQVIASGIGKVSGSYKPLISQCPETVPENIGANIYNAEGLVFADQTELNKLCGRLYAIAINTIEEVSIAMAGMYPLDIVPQVWWDIDLPDDYTKRGIEINSAMLCRAVDEEYNAQGGYVLPTGHFNPDPDAGMLGYTYVVPPEPKAPAATQPQQFSPITFPTYPTYIPPPFQQPGLQPIGDCAGNDSAPPNGPYQCDNYSSRYLYSSPTYGSNVWDVPIIARRSRAGTADYKTVFAIDGRFLYTTDGMLWKTMIDNSKITVELTLGGISVATATLTGGLASTLYATFNSSVVFDGLRITLTLTNGDVIYEKSTLLYTVPAVADGGGGTFISNTMIGGNYYAIEGYQGPWQMYCGADLSYAFAYYPYNGGGSWRHDFGYKVYNGQYALGGSLDPLSELAKFYDNVHAIVYYKHPVGATNLAVRYGNNSIFWGHCGPLGVKVYECYPPTAVYKIEIYNLVMYNVCSV